MRKRVILVLCADVDDNHPSYLPLWSKQGSNYESFRGEIKHNWDKSWSHLLDELSISNLHTTWLIRTDEGPVYSELAKYWRDTVATLEDRGDEIGVHPHPLYWNPLERCWIQARNPQRQATLVSSGIRRFKNIFHRRPQCSRIGFNAMSNEVMMELERSGIKVDATALPGVMSLGQNRGRDNVYDWSKAPSFPYHPSSKDYRQPGEMKILEVPITTFNQSIVFKSESFISPILSQSSVLARLAWRASQKLPFAGPGYLHISPWWNFDVKISLLEKQIRKSSLSHILITGYFHPCDIINPISGEFDLTIISRIRNLVSNLQSFAKVVSVNLGDIRELVRSGCIFLSKENQ
jgi:hypothetical protein